MEVFPDLHHKMSKKIAQLTKVIYHLNTKNEEHQTELDSLSTNHQLEIQQILRDAAVRIGKFKEILENKQTSVWIYFYFCIFIDLIFYFKSYSGKSRG